MKELNLYDDEVKLIFNPSRHTYNVWRNGSGPVVVPSVTRITNVLDKPALVYWASNQAAEYVRDNLTPGQVLDEVDIQDLYNQARFAYKQTSYKAMSIGSLAHNYIEAVVDHRLNDAPLPERPVNLQANASIDECFRWFQEHDVRPIAAEQIVYSRDHHYAGTLDLYAEVDGVPAVVDWKTSKGIYESYHLQAAGYVMAWREMGYDVECAYIVRIPKDGAGFETMQLGPAELERLGEVFRACRVIYRWMKEDA